MPINPRFNSKSPLQIRGLQKDYRLRSEDGRNFASDLNKRITFFAPLSTLGMLIVGLGQLFCLKKLFQQKEDPYTNLYRNKKIKDSAWLLGKKINSEIPKQGVGRSHAVGMVG